MSDLDPNDPRYTKRSIAYRVTKEPYAYSRDDVPYVQLSVCLHRFKANLKMQSTLECMDEVV